MRVKSLILLATVYVSSNVYAVNSATMTFYNVSSRNIKLVSDNADNCTFNAAGDYDNQVIPPGGSFTGPLHYETTGSTSCHLGSEVSMHVGILVQNTNDQNYSWAGDIKNAEELSCGSIASCNIVSDVRIENTWIGSISTSSNDGNFHDYAWVEFSGV